FRIAAVVVRAMTDDRHSADCNVGREHRMDLPHRRIPDGYAFDKNVLAPVRLNEVGPQTRTFAKDALAYRSSPRPKFHQPLPGCGLPGPPVPPMCFISLTIECSGAGNGEILLFEGIDEGRVVHQFRAFPTREYNWKVTARIGHEFQNRSFR